MSSPVNAFLTGTFTSDGTALTLSLPSEYTEVELTNITDIGSAAANTNVMKAWGTSSMAAGSAIYALKTSGAATIAIPSMTTSNGFTFVSDSGDESPGAALAVTSATNASPVVLTMNPTTGLSNGDVVRYYGATDQLNLAGVDFTISSVVSNTSITLRDSKAPGAAGTGGFVRRLPFNPRYYPRRRFITAISQASQAIVTLSVTHGYTAGQSVRLIVPSAFGMTQMNNLLGTIVAVGTTDGVSTNTITLNIDSSAFTAFAFPTSAVAAAGVSFAQVVPVGGAAISPYENLLDDATDNQSVRGVIIGTTIQTSGKLYQWVARKGTSI